MVTITSWMWAITWIGAILSNFVEPSKLSFDNLQKVKVFAGVWVGILIVLSVLSFF